MDRIRIAVCALRDVRETAARIRATHVVSLLDRSDAVRRPDGIPAGRHLRLDLADHEDPARPDAPTAGQVAAILDFARGAPDGSVLLVHCEGGRCRSTAAALAILAQDVGDAEEAATWLSAIAPRAIPNLLVAAHADTLLGMEGRLLAAATEIADRGQRRLIESLDR